MDVERFDRKNNPSGSGSPQRLASQAPVWALSGTDSADVVHPEAFRIGWFALRWYGVLVAVGFLVGLWTATRRAPLAGVPSERILELGPWLLLGTVIGARAVYVVTFWREQFAGQPFTEWFKIWQGGLVYYGGLVGASLSYIVCSQLKQIPLWTGADILAPSIALGQVFGRVGCLMFGCCYGKECHLPWAIRYPENHPTNPLDAEALPVHPTQLYESVLCLLLYVGLAWLFRKRKFEGEVFAAFLVGYAALRFAVECLRGDYPPNQMLLGGNATPAQVVSLIVLTVGTALLLILGAKAPRVHQ